MTHTPSQTQHEGETTQQKVKTIWSTTYVGPQTKYITKLFKHTNVKIAFKTKNDLTNLLSHRTQHQSTPTDMTKFNKSRIYRLQCPDCNMRYIRQTGRSFLTCYRKHYRDYKYNNGTSKYAQLLLENKHSIGPIHNTMEILHIMKKGKLMDTWEKFHIYQETKLGSQINDKNTFSQNTLFDTIIQKISNRGCP